MEKKSIIEEIKENKKKFAENVITLSEKEFLDVSANVIAELSEALKDPTAMLMFTMFTAALGKKLFEEKKDVN